MDTNKKRNEESTSSETELKTTEKPEKPKKKRAGLTVLIVLLAIVLVSVITSVVWSHLNTVNAGQDLGVGDTWTVDGQWALTVLSVTETDYIDEFAGFTPAAVYVVEYAYTNLGYSDTSGMMKGLSVSFGSQSTDAEGAEGVTCMSDTDIMPDEAPIGSSCRATVTVSLQHAGPFTLSVQLSDGENRLQTASFRLDPDAEPAVFEVPTSSFDAGNVLGIGDTWTVDGQWTLTITGCEVSDYRDSYDKHPVDAAYIVSYSYTNLGYEDPYGMGDSLCVFITDTVVDKSGMMGFDYPGEYDGFAQDIPTGESCEAQCCVGLEHDGPFYLIVSIPDSSNELLTQAFLIDPQ